MSGNRGLRHLVSRSDERCGGTRRILLPAETEIPAPAMTTIFCRLCSTFMTLSNSGRWSSSISPFRRMSRYSVVRSFEILRRLAGGGPSLSVLLVESIPSGAGDPDCEVCWDAGGEGYGLEAGRTRAGFGRRISGGGEGELAGELSGEEGAEESGLLGRLDRGLERPESAAAEVSSAGVDDMVAVAGRRRAEEEGRAAGGGW